MAEETVKIFVSGSCGPCQQVKQLVSEGKFNRDKVDIIDVETEEGFPMIEKMGLNKVPTAMKGTDHCDLSLDGETLIITCPGEEQEEAEESEEQM
jgi:hypothetical protein